MTLTGLKLSVHVGKKHLEESLSQNFDKHPCLFFHSIKKMAIGIKWEKYQKLPVFCSEINKS